MEQLSIKNLPQSKHYDVILFFKLGKFYELFHMDADVGVQELNLSYMGTYKVGFLCAFYIISFLFPREKLEFYKSYQSHERIEKM